jgi:putative transposase
MSLPLSVCEWRDGGRWHVSFPAPQPAVSDAGRAGKSIGIDRGVATTIATSNGQMFRAPRMGNVLRLS